MRSRNEDTAFGFMSLVEKWESGKVGKVGKSAL